MTSRRDRSCCCDAPTGNGTAACCDMDGGTTGGVTYPGCSEEYRINWSSLLWPTYFDSGTLFNRAECCQVQGWVGKGSVEVERGDAPVPCFIGNVYYPKKIYTGTECNDNGATYWMRPAHATGGLTYSTYDCTTENECDPQRKVIACSCKSDCSTTPDMYHLNGGTIRAAKITLHCESARDLTTDPPCSMSTSGQTGKRFVITMSFAVGVCIDGFGADCTNPDNCGQGTPSDWRLDNLESLVICNCNANDTNTCGCGSSSAQPVFEVIFRSPDLETQAEKILCPGGLTFTPYSWTGSGTFTGAVSVTPI